MVFSMIMTVYVQLNLSCEKYDNRRNLGNSCTLLLEASKCKQCHKVYYIHLPDHTGISLCVLTGYSQLESILVSSEY